MQRGQHAGPRGRRGDLDQTTLRQRERVAHPLHGFGQLLLQFARKRRVLVHDPEEELHQAVELLATWTRQEFRAERVRVAHAGEKVGDLGVRLFQKLLLMQRARIFDLDDLGVQAQAVASGEPAHQDGRGVHEVRVAGGGQVRSSGRAAGRDSSCVAPHLSNSTVSATIWRLLVFNDCAARSHFVRVTGLAGRARVRGGVPVDVVVPRRQVLLVFWRTT